MDKQPISEETRINLRSTVENRIDEISKEVDELRNIYEKLERTESFAIENKLFIDLKSLKSLLEFRLFIGLLNLDLCTAVRIYLNAKFQYEGVSSARQIIVIINEGYKKIYNFLLEKENGVKVT